MADEIVRYNITSVRRQFCQNSVDIASPQRSLSQSPNCQRALYPVDKYLFADSSSDVMQR